MTKSTSTMSHKFDITYVHIGALSQPKNSLVSVIIVVFIYEYYNKKPCFEFSIPKMTKHIWWCMAHRIVQHISYLLLDAVHSVLIISYRWIFFFRPIRNETIMMPFLNSYWYLIWINNKSMRGLFIGNCGFPFNVISYVSG